ncbi:MAG: HdeA/HdeB family chaperone [Cellvibrionaceae bacterium]
MSYGFRLFVLALVFSSTPSLAAENTSESTFDLRSIDCKKFLELKEQNRDYLFFFLYGFSSGLDGDYKHSVKKIEKAVDILGDSCSDNPEAKVFDVLESMKLNRGPQ